MTPELIVAVEAARAAGAILLRHLDAGVSLRSKDVANLVTDADVEAERAVVDVIRRHFPDHEIVGEEGQEGDVGAEHVWVVDPLDGTNNFAHAIPQFSVSIGYYRAGVAHAGVVLDPVRDDLFTAARGLGAFKNGQRARVSDHDRLDRVVVAVGFPYDRDRLMDATLGAIRSMIVAETHGVRRFGSAALDLCGVGLGHFGAYFEYVLSPWDYAAGRLFVDEAGGVVTTALGGPIHLEKSSLLATNGRLHAEALEIVSAHHP